MPNDLGAPSATQHDTTCCTTTCCTTTIDAGLAQETMLTKTTHSIDLPRA